MQDCRRTCRSFDHILDIAIAIFMHGLFMALLALFSCRMGYHMERHQVRLAWLHWRAASCRGRNQGTIRKRPAGRAENCESRKVDNAVVEYMRCLKGRAVCRFWISCFQFGLSMFQHLQSWRKSNNVFLLSSIIGDILVTGCLLGCF